MFCSWNLHLFFQCNRREQSVHGARLLETSRRTIDSGGLAGRHRPSLVINAISNWVVLGVSIGVGFFLTPFIIRHLGKTGYGIWVLIGSVIGYYGLLDLGIGSATTRYVARYAGRGEEKSLNETISTAFVMFSCTGALVIVTSLLVAAPLAGFFRVGDAHTHEFKLVVWILGLTTGLNFPASVFGTVIKAHERYVAANVVYITSTFIRVLLTVWLLLKGVGLVGVALAALVSTVADMCMSLAFCRRLTPWVRISFAFAHWRVVRMLIIYGGVTTVIVIADLMRFNLDSFVIGKWVGIAEVGVYGIAALLIRYMLRLITAGMSVLTPRFAALDGAKENAKLQALFLRSLSVSALLSFGTGMLAIIFGGRFIKLWITEPGFFGTIPVLYILAVAYTFALAQNPGISLMFATNKHHFFAAATVVEAVANLTLSLVLVRKYGIIGVALGTAIPMAIVKVFVQPVYVAHIAGVSLWHYAKPLVIPAIVASLMVGISRGYGIWQFIDRCNFTRLFVWGAIAGLAFLAVVAFLILTVWPTMGFLKERRKLSLAKRI